MPTPHPKILAIYDNGGKTLDRYTIVLKTFTRQNGFQLHDCIGASEHGHGVFLHSTCTRGSHLGKKITLDDLSPCLKGLVEDVVNN